MTGGLVRTFYAAAAAVATWVGDRKIASAERWRHRAELWAARARGGLS